MINRENLLEAVKHFKGAAPFDHAVVDDFFPLEIARQLERDFIDYDSEKWFTYKNAIEDKKTLNDWHLFPESTYQVFQYLMSLDFVSILEQLLQANVYVDHGLHGGGWHIHGVGGNLNPHLDYVIHPKMKKLRKLNLIVYLSESLDVEHGGHLGLWANDADRQQPGALVSEVPPRFNRGIIFDTTQNSWHGMSRPLSQPSGVYRKSLAIYYLTDPPANVDARERALFAPREDQRGDRVIQDLIKIRSDNRRFHEAYKK